ncbi:MAG: phosphoribosylaminoimidazolesuccinocarboxamide synthase [Candidatus Pacebacteria bacterium]|nr:phosphoribosylaminoimidazolesuccinocarboxamide synthase [Candidatus Paceibacterota bacterium]
MDSRTDFRGITGVLVEKDPVIEGKTKAVYQVVDEPHVVLASKDSITAGNGARCEDASGKAEISNEMTCLIFSYLKEQGLPVAFLRRVDNKCLMALALNMYKLEVVERHEAFGSICKREGLEKGTKLSPPRFELYLKTTGRVWEMNDKKWDLICDDPRMEIDSKIVKLYDPGAALSDAKPFLELCIKDVFENPEQALAHIKEMAHINLRATQAIRDLCAKVGINCPDFKLEYGIHGPDGQLYIGDVADFESGRAVYNGAPSGEELYPNLIGQHICKEFFRKGGDKDETVYRYGVGLDLLRKAIAA